MLVCVCTYRESQDSLVVKERLVILDAEELKEVMVLKDPRE